MSCHYSDMEHWFHGVNLGTEEKSQTGIFNLFSFSIRQIHQKIVLRLQLTVGVLYGGEFLLCGEYSLAPDQHNPTQP